MSLAILQRIPDLLHLELELDIRASRLFAVSLYIIPFS